MAQAHLQQLSPIYSYGDAVAVEQKSALQQLTSICFIIILITAISMTILRMRHPDVFYDIIMDVDVLGVTQSSHQEKQRLASIALLPISDEKKNYLINHTIYMGAAPQMVTLALGNPRGIQEVYNPETKNKQIIYIYHFNTDSRPTMLAFENDILIAAQKAPANFQYSELVGGK